MTYITFHSAFQRWTNHSRLCIFFVFFYDDDDDCIEISEGDFHLYEIKYQSILYID